MDSLELHVSFDEINADEIDAASGADVRTAREMPEMSASCGGSPLLTQSCLPYTPIPE